MMLRKRRRPTPFVSDSSEDDYQATKYNHTGFNNSSHASNTSNSHQSNGGSCEDADDVNDILHPPRKKRKNRRLYSSEEIDSSEDEEIVHPVRRGSMRALSDYESGTSSDYISGASERNSGDSVPIGEDPPSVQPNVIPTKSGVFVAEHCEQRSDWSESSSSSGVTLSSRNKRKRMSNVVSSSDSYDSDVSIAPLSLQRRRNRIHSTDDEYDPTNTLDFRRTGAEDISAEYRSDSPTQYEVRRERQEDRNNTTLNLGAIQIGIRDNGNSSYSDNESSDSDNESSDSDNVSSDCDIESSDRDNESSDSDTVVNHYSFRNRFRFPVSAFNTVFNSSSTDSEEELPVRNRVRRSAAIPINESDDDETETAECRNENVPSPTSEKTTKPSSGLGRSSESDGESETCPICLGGFNEQEVGVPSTCEHCFCLTCIQEWAKNNNTCPVDRKKFNKLVVYDKAHGTIARHIAVENPVRSLIESVELWESVAAEIMFTVQQINANENNGNSSSEEVEYDEEAEEICGVCRLSSNDLYSDMIECDECNRAFHMACVRLNTIPVNSWYCHDCVSLG